MKDARSCRVSSNTPAVLPLSKPGFFSAYLSHRQGSYVVYIFWPWRPVDILWPFLDKGWSTRKLVSLEVFFLYTSNLRQRQKVLNKVTFSWSKGAVDYNNKKELIYIFMEQRCSGLQQQRRNLLAQRADVVNTKATTFFLLHSNYIN